MTIMVLRQELTDTQYLALLKLAKEYRDEIGSFRTWNETSDEFKIGCIIGIKAKVD